jgi:hypothetical protein
MSKTKTITTPVGIGRYTWLNTPDKTYDEAYGVYRTDLILSEEDWNAFKLEIKPLYEQAFADEQVKQGKKKLKQHGSPISIDEEGQHILKCKLKAGGKRKDGTEYSLSVGRFDGNGKPLDKGVTIGGGSKIKLAIRPKFWYVSSLGFGMTLEPHAVQVLGLEAVQAGSGSATTYGFTAVEGAYQQGGETFEETLDAEAETKETELKANF